MKICAKRQHKKRSPENQQNNRKFCKNKQINKNNKISEQKR